MKDHQDAYGHEIYDHFMGEAGSEVVERDDGYVCASPGPKAYLAQYDDWSPADVALYRHLIEVVGVLKQPSGGS